jgi:hypothetical protein
MYAGVREPIVLLQHRGLRPVSLKRLAPQKWQPYLLMLFSVRNCIASATSSPKSRGSEASRTEKPGTDASYCIRPWTWLETQLLSDL